MVAFAGDCLRDRHTGFSFWGFCFVSCKILQQTNKGKNKQTNAAVPFCLGVARDSSCGSVHCPPRCHVRRGRLKIEFGFRQTKNSFLILKDAITALLVCVAVVRPPFCVRGYARTIARNNEQGGNTSWHLSHCIRVRRPGFQWRDILSRHNRLLGLRARAFSSAKGLGRLAGECWLVMAFACNYSDLFVVLKIRRNVVHGDNMILGLYILGRLSSHGNRYTRTCSCILLYAGIVLAFDVSTLSLCLRRNTIHASSST